MEGALRAKVCSMSCVGGIKISDEARLPEDAYLRHPSLLSFFPTDTKKTSRISLRWAPHILRVDWSRNIPKVRNPVVLWVAVNVVYFRHRPKTVNVQPGEAVQSVKTVVD